MEAVLNYCHWDWELLRTNRCWNSKIIEKIHADDRQRRPSSDLNELKIASHAVQKQN
jgi:hypothetical protein